MNLIATYLHFNFVGHAHLVAGGNGLFLLFLNIAFDFACHFMWQAKATRARHTRAVCGAFAGVTILLAHRTRFTYLLGWNESDMVEKNQELT
jgi:hypothetical protein